MEVVAERSEEQVHINEMDMGSLETLATGVNNVDSREAKAVAAASETLKLFDESNRPVDIHFLLALLDRVHALNGSHTLNFNGFFSSCTEDDRSRELAFWFRLVDDLSIQNLLLQHNKIDLVALAKGLKIFKGCSLQEIYLSDNLLQHGGIEVFCLLNWSDLCKLSFRGNNVTNRRHEPIAFAIQTGRLKALESIDLSINYIKDAGFVSLAGSFDMRFLPHLRTVILGRNAFGNLRVEAIARAMSAGGLQLLKQLDLSSDNLIKDSSMISLASLFGTGQVSHLKRLISKACRLMSTAS